MTDTKNLKPATLAIVGRPNVGKSTLFNRIIGRRRAIVGDEPGITRDRLYGEADWNGRRFTVVDTGGIIPEDKDLIPAEIFRQARVALQEADVVVMVVDGRSEVAGPDIELARLLLRSGKPVFLAVNKIDAPKLEAHIHGHVFLLAAGANILASLLAVFVLKPWRKSVVERATLEKPVLSGAPA